MIGPVDARHARAIFALFDRRAPQFADPAEAGRDDPQACARTRRGRLTASAEDGRGIRVAEVASGSPAARAGFRAGELLVAIDGAPARDLGLRRAQAILMTPGTSLRVLIEDESGGVREAELPLAGSGRSP